MIASEKAIDLIARFEGFSSAPYLDPIGVPTIGYGSTWGRLGSPITLEHPPIDKDEGKALLEMVVRSMEVSIGRLARVALEQHQFDALVSFTYNVGTGNFQRSTMRMKLNRGDYSGAANEFWKWRRAGGRILPGLVRRRAAEERMFRGLG